MGFATFLKDRALAVVAVTCSGCAVGAAASIAGAGADAAVFMALTVFCFGALCLAAEYRRRKRFYDDLQALTQRFDKMYLASALLEEPGFLEGRLAYEALDALGKSATDDVAKHRRQAQSYREYVELWIHEVKTPIAAAKLMAAGLHGPEASKLKGELDRIEGYVEQALYYARSTSLEQDYAIRETGLAETVREACRKNARFLIEHGTVPAIEVPNDVRVLADAKWLSFMVGQVIANSAKYGAACVRFSVREEAPGTVSARTVLEIADDGKGIPAADVPRAFDHGFTGANGRAAGSSTGMGLYLVAQLCEKMGLGVGIASEEGTGTRVMLSFPHDRRGMVRSNLTKP